MKVLSGIQPTGRFHWGNYFGAIAQYIDLQNNEQAFYFIADLFVNYYSLGDLQSVSGFKHRSSITHIEEMQASSSSSAADSSDQQTRVVLWAVPRSISTARHSPKHDSRLLVA